MHYLRHIFNKFKSIFKHTDNLRRLAANQMYEATQKS